MVAQDRSDLVVITVQKAVEDLAEGTQGHAAGLAIYKDGAGNGRAFLLSPPLGRLWRAAPGLRAKVRVESCHWCRSALASSHHSKYLCTSKGKLQAREDCNVLLIHVNKRGYTQEQHIY